MAIRGVTGLLFKGKVRKAASLASRKVKRTFGLGRSNIATRTVPITAKNPEQLARRKARVMAVGKRMHKSQRRARAGAVLGTVGVAGVGTALAVRKKRKKA